MADAKNVSWARILFLLIKKIFRIALDLGWLFIRMTVYWIARLLYRVFNLAEIDVVRTRKKHEGNFGLTDFKGHTFTFKRSNEFVYNYHDYLELIRTLDIDEGDKEDLINYTLTLVAEAERSAFDTIYQYVLSKGESATFDDFILNMIFSGNNKEVEVREKTKNPYTEPNATEKRRHDRVFGTN